MSTDCAALRAAGVQARAGCIIVTAETDEGRRAIEEVMAHSCQTDIEGVPPEWARALVAGAPAASRARAAGGGVRRPPAVGGGGG
jgi:hypothetical protein